MCSRPICARQRLKGSAFGEGYEQQKAANPKKHELAAIMASQKGLEPPTFRLGGERSIQLSY